MILTSSSPRAGRERWGRVACVLCGGRRVEGTLKFLRSFLITLNRFCPGLRTVGADLWCRRPRSTDRLHSPPVRFPHSYGPCLNVQRGETQQLGHRAAPQPWLHDLRSPLFLPRDPLTFMNIIEDPKEHLLRFARLDVNTKGWKCSQIFAFLKIKNIYIYSRHFPGGPVADFIFQRK